MKAAFTTLLALAAILTAVVVVQADDAKDSKDKKGEEKKYEGELGCAKCVYKLKGYTKCANAIKVKEDDKDVYYVLDDKGRGEKYHGPICTAKKKGTVTGTAYKPEEGEYKKIKPAADGVKYD